MTPLLWALLALCLFYAWVVFGCWRDDREDQAEYASAHPSRHVRQPAHRLS